MTVADNYLVTYNQQTVLLADMSCLSCCPRMQPADWTHSKYYAQSEWLPRCQLFNIYNARHKADDGKQKHPRCMTWLTLEAQRRSACSLKSFKSLPAMPGEACATVASSASDRCLAYWCRICALQISSGSPNCTDVLNLHETYSLTETTNCTLG